MGLGNPTENRLAFRREQEYIYLLIARKLRVKSIVHVIRVFGWWGSVSVIAKTSVMLLAKLGGDAKLGQFCVGKVSHSRERRVLPTQNSTTFGSNRQAQKK